MRDARAANTINIRVCIVVIVFVSAPELLQNGALL